MVIFVEVVLWLLYAWMFSLPCLAFVVTLRLESPTENVTKSLAGSTPNIHAVDGINLVYPIIYKVLYIPGGAGVFPSIVGDFVTRFGCFGDL